MKFKANDLRHLAETADGWRDVDLYAYVKDKKLKLSKTKPSNDVRWIAVKTGCTKPHDMGCPSKVKLATQKNPSGTTVFAGKGTDDYFDSLFWAQSSVEKFMVPYYARIFTATQMRRLRKAYTDPNVVAIGHRFPTVYGEFKASEVEAKKKESASSEFNNITLFIQRRDRIDAISLADYT
jgi:hypothetical protein